MPSVYVTGTAGPWLCDDDNVTCDGTPYTGTLYPYNQNLPTVDGTFPAPNAILSAIGIIASYAATGFQAPNAATGTLLSYTSRGVLEQYAATGVME